ncbi:MAG: family 20 glycosylhydrolase [Armatimonadota bacterium]
MLKPSPTPLVMPYPREMKLSKTRVALSGIRTLADGKTTERAAKALKAGLKELGVPIADDGFPVSLVLVEQAVEDELYDLQIKKTGAIIGAGTYAGLYYGVQTLLQLVLPSPPAPLPRDRRRSPGEGSQMRQFRLPLGTVSDRPIKPIRGIHTYLPARENLPYFKRFIEWLGRHKINTMFLEVGAGMEYKRHPEINKAWVKFCKEAMSYPGGPDALQDSQYFWKNSTHTELAGGSFLTQKEIKQIVKWCADNAIEIMPEVQSLSHSYYLCMAHPEIAEVKEDPWPDTYCPSNPKSYELYFELLEEIIEVFTPRLIHIGHDEAYIFQFCEECKQRDPAEIFATDITKVHDWLAERGIGIAIWGDKLLEIHHPSGTIYGGVERDTVRYGKPFHMPAINRCVDLIPKDTLIFDWYWSLSYDSAKMLADKGFQMIYGNFHAPSFENWQKHRENKSLLGGEASLWAEVDDWSIGRNGSYHTLLWAANDLWSDFDPDTNRQQLIDDIALVMQRDRLKLGDITSVIQAPGKKRFKPVDMRNSATRACYPGDAPGADLTYIPRGKSTLGGVEFFVPPDKGEPATVPVVDWHLRSCPPIKLEQRADALVFLHTTDVQRVHAPTYYSLNLGRNLIGAYLITYEDGKVVEVPLEYSWNIDSFNSRFMAGKSGDMADTIGAFDYAADPVLEGVTKEGRGYTVFMYEWVNPRPKKAIRDVRLTWGGGYTSGTIALLALTVVEKE